MIHYLHPHKTRLRPFLGALWAILAAGFVVGCATRPKAEVTYGPMPFERARYIKSQVADMNRAVAGVIFYPTSMKNKTNQGAEQ